jgi:hypothetical protein
VKDPLFLIVEDPLFFTVDCGGSSFLHCGLWRILFSSLWTVEDPLFFTVDCGGSSFLHCGLWRILFGEQMCTIYSFQWRPEDKQSGTEAAPQISVVLISTKGLNYALWKYLIGIPLMKSINQFVDEATLLSDSSNRHLISTRNQSLPN